MTSMFDLSPIKQNTNIIHLLASYRIKINSVFVELIKTVNLYGIKQPLQYKLIGMWNISDSDVIYFINIFCDKQTIEQKKSINDHLINDHLILYLENIFPKNIRNNDYDDVIKDQLLISINEILKILGDLILEFN